MKNSLYNPYITEPIHHVTSQVAGICYHLPNSDYPQPAQWILNDDNIISLHNHLATEAALIIIPLCDSQLEEWIYHPERYLHLQDARVRIGINYRNLKTHQEKLLELTNAYRFWLFDFAPPGADCHLVESFPFSAIVLSHTFFNDNYRKFTFPFFIESLRGKGARIIVRGYEPTLTAEQLAALNICGWQLQRASGDLIPFTL
ncbi:hypothetical protein QM637_09035 [Pantoea allii]|uniref:hypothetical protein n=1 Tax=Pantoea allii TaxID=574096 RepID=UPI000A23BB4B|nr:hypothetical protein [Pantoea allii]MBW1251169.1 hypothetical protein [Pantoea allii]MBW1260954.1 hypothetical protein [Pantoea allii]MBW1282363.1 hypothetical protein [Pantoea allii]MCH9297230.1 hypothetical protein [Pantoea allii]MDJ0035981.1 hypothetical protein [Pantoea allii]